MVETDVAYRLDRPLRFDLNGAGYKADPGPTLAAMRAAGPVIPVRVPLVGRVWMATSHAAVLAMLKDASAFVQESRHAGKSGLAGMQWWMPKRLLLLANNMLLRDEPDHRRLRKLVDRSFQRRDIGHMRGRIEAIADRLLDQMGDRGEIDLVSTYARRLPMAVICDLLGLAEADQESFGIWTRKMVDIKGPLDVFGFIGGLDALIGYLQAQIEDCRRKPRAGLIADLVREEQDGDRLSESELLSMILLLLVAGFETTSHLISGAVLALEAHPEQKAWLLAEPQARIERAVEELARFVTPVETTKPRYVAQDVTFFGQEMSRGDVVLPSLAAANHDPAVFGHPDRLDLDRFPNPHLVFSSGIHFCLGMQLARVEAQSALLRLYARRPNLQVIAPDRLPWIEQLGIRGMRSLPVRFG